jgi:hypothetical protein
LLRPVTTTDAAPFSSASSRHSGSERTTVQPGCTTASFSAAIASRVSPSTSMWSSATLVRTTTRVWRTFVASCRPPSPASTTPTSTPASAKATRAAAVSTSNWVAESDSAGRLTRVRAVSRSISTPSSRIRSCHETT